MLFQTTCTSTLSCLASAAPQVDSWRLGHVVPDDVVIADIADQALDIFLHGPVCAQEWHPKDIHSHIHFHPLMHTPKTKSKTLNSPNMTLSFSCLLPVQRGGGRQPGSLADSHQD